MNQINCYQNVWTRLIVTPKWMDQNGVFAYIFLGNLTVELNILYTLNTHIKFYVN